MHIRKEISVIVGILVLTAIYIIGALRLGAPMYRGEPTESTFPWIIIIVMLTACSIKLFPLMKKIKVQQALDEERIKGVNISFLLGIAGLSAFIAAFLLFGYWIAAIILTFVTSYIFEAHNENKKKKWLYIIVLTVLIPIIGYLFYGTIFNIHFPKGLLF